MKKLLKPRKKEEASNFLEKTIPYLKYSLIFLIAIGLISIVFNGLNIMFDQTNNSADPLVGLFSIILALIISYILLIIINVLESILLGFVIIVEKNEIIEDKENN